MMQKELPIPYTHDEVLSDPSVIKQMAGEPGYHRFGVCRICGLIRWLGASRKMKDGDEGKVLIEMLCWLPLETDDQQYKCRQCHQAKAQYGDKIQTYIKQVTLAQQRILQATLS